MIHAGARIDPCAHVNLNFFPQDSINDHFLVRIIAARHNAGSFANKFVSMTFVQMGNVERILKVIVA